MINPSEWQPADGLTLEPNALRCAKNSIRSLALIAGPGSGKTEMLAQRADFLLRTDTCAFPKRILAISFKVDASINLKERVRRRCGPELARRFDSYTFHGFAKRIVDKFRPILTGADALDPDYTIGQPRITRRQIGFNDLMSFAALILTNSAVARNAVRATYGFVFLDEFQDCTKLQYEMIRNAFGGTEAILSAVGDTKQMIMSFAGAIEGIFIQYVADFAAESLNLYRNFRSKPLLLRMQNDMIARMDPSAAVDPSEIAGDSGSIEIHEFADDVSEARVIAQRVCSWIADGTQPNEIAIIIPRQVELYAGGLTSELTRLGIPWRNEQTVQDLTAEPIVRLITDFLRVLFGAREPAAFERLMHHLIDPFVSESNQDEMRSAWYRFLRRQKADVRVTADNERSFLSVWHHVEEFVQFAGRPLLVGLSGDYEHGKRLDDLIDSFKSHLAETYAVESDVVRSLDMIGEQHAVRLMTAHKSKGLEFEVVVLIGVEEETYWGEEASNRCEYFVAISRAKSLLVLTSSSTRQRPDGFKKFWRVNRTPHEEFLGYARPYAS